MSFYPSERIALFIDGSNLFAAARTLGFDIDYKALLNEFASKGHLVRALYYTALIEDQDFSPPRHRSMCGASPADQARDCSSFVGQWKLPTSRKNSVLPPNRLAGLRVGFFAFFLGRYLFG